MAAAANAQDSAGAGRVVIIGGHGKVALLAAPRLSAAGFSVDALIRNPEHAADVSAAGANPVELDIESAGVDELAAAFSGASAVVFAAGAGGGNPARTHAVDFESAVRSMDAAQQAGVARYVMVSYARASRAIDSLDPEDSFFPYAKAKHDADAHLRATDLDYTILGPGKLTLEPSSGAVTLADDAGEPVGAGAEAPDQTRDTSRDLVAEVITHVIAAPAGSRSTVNFYDGPTPVAEAIG